MVQKPLLPMWYTTQDRVIKNRVNRILNTEVYLLDDGEFLYVITDLQLQDVLKNKIKKHGLFGIKVWLNEYVGLISHQLEIPDLAKIKQSLTTKVGFEAIAGMHELKNLFMKELIEPLNNPERYKKYKLSIPNGILFFGPPWCGKTFITRKLAEEVWYNFYEIKHSDIASPYIHGTTWKIWEVFAIAKENSPSIVFFDELSGLVPKRDDLVWGWKHKEEEVNEFLIQLNDASKNNILVIGATNYPDRIDTAIMRAGRLDKRIYIGPPDFDARKELFEMYLSGRPIENIDFEKLAELTKGTSVSKKTSIGFDTWNTEKKFSELYVASDIQVMCDNCARRALAENSIITMDVCEAVIKDFTPSVSREDLDYYKSFIQAYQRV